MNAPAPLVVDDDPQSRRLALILLRAQGVGPPQGRHAT